MRKKTTIIAEVGQAHEGSLGIAHSYIDALSNTGIDVVKFQTHIADSESGQEEPFRIKFSYEDKTRYDYWRRMEFSLEQWIGLKKHCDDLNLEFMSTPSCLAAVDLLEQVGVKRYKIGSGDLTNKLLIKKIADTKKPIILSAGMSSMEDIHCTFEYLNKLNLNYSLLHCTSQYPMNPENGKMSLINEYKSKFSCPIGYSDHSGTIFPSIAATTLGAEIIEFHVVFDKNMFGPDSTSSITIKEAYELVKGIRCVEKLFTEKGQKDIDGSMNDMKNIFEKSLAVNKDLKKGHCIVFDDLESKKPSGFGVSVIDFEKVIGGRLNKDIKKYEFLNYEDIINEHS